MAVKYFADFWRMCRREGIVSDFVREHRKRETRRREWERRARKIKRYGRQKVWISDPDQHPHLQ